MSKLETIQDFLDATKEEREEANIQIRGQIVSDIEEEEFHFHDVSEAIWVQINSEKIRESKYLAKNKFVKIINPGLNVLNDFKRLVLNDNSKVIPTARLKTLTDLGIRAELAREDLSYERIKKMLPNDVSINMILTCFHKI